MDEITQEIYFLVKKKMAEQGAYDRDAYAGFIDETVDYFYEKGKLDDDENVELIKDQLMAMWEETEDGLSQTNGIEDYNEPSEEISDDDDESRELSS